MKIQRAKTSSPTEGGFYYARPKDEPNEAICPVHVCAHLRDPEGHLFVAIFDEEYPLEMFDFFGPIDECEELAFS